MIKKYDINYFSMVFKKYIFLSGILLFVIPTVTLFICFLIIAHFYPDFYTIPFIDGKASISMIGRGEKTIVVFKSGFFLYILVSIFFYLKISNFFLLREVKNKLKIFGLLANFFLCIYIFTLGKDGLFYEAPKRLAIIFHISTIYISHIYLIKILKSLKQKKIINFNNIYLIIFYTIIAIMTILVIIGLPWVNPLFKYPNELKNIIEWNFFLLAIIFYIPVSLIFFNLK